jgi:hypothetical protein
MLFLMVLACTVGESSTVLHCDLTGPVLTPVEAAPGSTVVAVSRPMTTSWDTLVAVGGSQAAVSAVDRTECEACDTCREAAECNVCGTCTECAQECSPCVESVSFVVPTLAPGAYPVVVTNLHAASVGVTLTVADGGEDTGGTDTGDTAGDTSGGAETGDTSGGI